MKQCSQCNTNYEKLSLHWDGDNNKCEPPKPTDEQKQILKGLLMGDGYITSTPNSNYFSTEMKNKEFLEWLESELGTIATEVRPKKENTFVLNTRASVDYFDELRKWYKEEGKRYPSDLSLTPIITKMWYISDGTKFKQTSGSRPQLRIACSNESDRLDELIEMFEEIGISPHTAGEAIEFSRDDSDRLIDYMGKPVKGFERKWF